MGKGHDGVFFIGNIDVRVSLGVILSLKVWRVSWGLGLNRVVSDVQLIVRKMVTEVFFTSFHSVYIITVILHIEKRFLLLSSG